MSLQSWRDEFYSVEAKDATGSALEAAEHSLRKWIGLRRENLERHGLEFRGYATVREIGTPDMISSGFCSAAATCALCEYVGRDERRNVRCRKCPLAKANSAARCDMREDAPYTVFSRIGDPEPMISWLEKTVEYCKQQAVAEDDMEQRRRFA